MLGRGGMGVVYRALQLSLDRTVALKVIAPDLAMDAEFRERFKHESRLAASIEHPNVIPVYEAGERDGLLYLIMRYVEGTDLRALLDGEGPLDPRRAAPLVGQVAAALAAAHGRDLVHRDVKPANVLIGSAGSDRHAYLTDFGIARSLSATSGLTRTGAVVGTLDYIAPERLERPAGDPRSDIYALGCVLFEALTGSVPYPRDSEPAKMYAHVSAPVPSPRALRAEVPEQLDSLVRRAMAKDPAERPGTAGEVAEVLLAFGGEAPARARSDRTQPARAEEAEGHTEATPAGATVAAATEPLGEQSPPPSEPARAKATGSRRIPVGALAGLLAAAVVAVAAVLALGGGDPSEPGGGDGDASAKGPLAPAALAPVSVGPGADGVAVGEGSVWVAKKDDDAIVRVNPETRRREGSTPVGDEPDSIAVGAGSVWVTNSSSDDVSRIDPQTAEVVERVPVGRAPEGIAVGNGAAWVANSGAGTVTRIDTGDGTRRTSAVGRGPIQLAVAPDAIWVTLTGDETIAALDPETGERAGEPIAVGGAPRGIDFAAGLLWVSSTKTDRIVVVDPSAGTVVDRIRVAENPREVRAGEGGIWVTNADASKVTAIDPGSRTVAGTVSVEGKPFGLGVGGGLVWAAGLDNGLLTPIRPRAS